MKRIVLSVCAALAAAVSAWAETYTWTGGTGTWNASSGASWTASSGQSTGTVPGANDAVIIPGAATEYTVTVSEPFAVASLVVGSSEDGTKVKVVFENGVSTNVVSGSVHLLRGATLKHTSKYAVSGSGTAWEKTYTVQRRLSLAVGGDMTIDDGAAIDVTACGYPSGAGAGCGDEYMYGGSYGGHAQRKTVYPSCYGSIRAPMDYGSGGQWATGGGSVNLVVAGNLTVNGAIRSNGGSVTERGAAGGSVFLTVGTLLGSGSIEANGSLCDWGGAGGRISIVEKIATESRFTEGISCIGSNGGGASASGTIYRENKSDEPGRGTLVVPSQKSANTSYQAELVASRMPDANEPFGAIFVEKNAGLRLFAGTTCTVMRAFSVVTGNGASFTADVGSCLKFVGAGDACVTGSLTFAGLECTEPGKRIVFTPGAAGKTSIKAGGKLTVRGTDEKPVELWGADGAEWLLNLDASARTDILHASVTNSNASSGSSLLAISSNDLGGNQKWAFKDPILPGEVNEWTGTVSSDWSDEKNWSLARLPIETDEVQIVDPAAQHFPVLTVANTTWNKLTVGAGTSLTLSGSTIAVTNELVVAGTLIFSGRQYLSITGPKANFAGGAVVPAESTVRILDGVSAFDPGGCTFYRVEVRRAGGALALASGFRAETFDMRVTGDAEMSFAAGSVIEANSIVGVCTGAEEERRLTLRSSAPGTAWELKSPQEIFMLGVSVSDSTASDAPVVAGLSDNGDGNTNWTFGGDVRMWRGDTDGFGVAENWYPAGALTENSAVIIPSGAKNPKVSAVTSVRSLTIGGDHQTVQLDVSAELTFSHSAYLGSGATVVVDKPTSVGSNVVMAAGSSITHTALPSTANEPKDECYRVMLSVGGNMTVGKNAAVTANGKGYRTGKGPGYINKTAAHGGAYSLEAMAKCYGSLMCPTNCGSGSNLEVGGGSVRLIVAGSLTVNGSISADSLTYSARKEYYSASGGSVWITCGELLGSGTLSVAADFAYYGFGGGGGRLAVYLTEATDFSAWRGRMKAHGAPSDGNTSLGGAGTIYLQAAGQEVTNATVVIDNEGAIKKNVALSSQSHGYTPLIAKYGADVIGNLIVTNAARVTFGDAGETDSIYGDVDTTGGTILSYGGTVELAGGRTQTIRGAGAWDDFKCTVPGKTIRIGTGAGDVFNFRSTSLVTLMGSEDEHLVLVPDVPGETWKMKLPVGGQAEVSYVTVDHSDASGAGVVTITAKNSTDLGDNENWSFPKPMLVGDPVTWTGAIDSDWNKAGNWVDRYDESRLPTSDDKIVIPAGCTNWPILPSASSYWGLDVDTNATLTITGGPIAITNTLKVAGTLIISGHQTLAVSASTASFAGATVVPGESTIRILDGVDTFDPGNCTFCRVAIPLEGSSLVLTDGLKARSFEVRATDNATVTFAAGKTIEADTIVCSCMEAGKYLTLQSSAASEKWFLKSPRISYMTGVKVSDSTATAAAAVASLSLNVGESNVNWIFDNGVSEWVGGASGKFDVAENWYPEGVPGVANDVILRGAAEITADGNVSVRSLALLPDEVKGSLTVNGVLTTVGDAVIGTNATLTLSTVTEFNEIGGDFIVGGTVTHPALPSTAKTLADGEKGAKLLVRAKNVVVEYGGMVDATGKGYPNAQGPASDATANYDKDSQKWTSVGHVDAAGNHYTCGAGHAGTMNCSRSGAATTSVYPVLTDYRAYGSMYEPTTYGSGGNESTPGGGVIRLVASGDVTVDGTITAAGKDGWNYGHSGAGGSVWITAGGALKGAATGLISAAGGKGLYRNTPGGGRIAVYAGVNRFNGRYSASGKMAANVVTQAPGTVLTKFGDEDIYSLVIDYDEYASKLSGYGSDGNLAMLATDIPTAEDLDKLDLFKRTSVTCGNLTVLNLTRDLKLYDLNFTAGAASKARLNLHTLKLLSSAHKKGKGWAVKNAGDDPIATHIWPCEKDGAKGKVVWSAGMALIVR